MTWFWGMVMGLAILAVLLLGLEYIDVLEGEHEEEDLGEEQAEENARPHGNVDNVIHLPRWEE